MINKLLRYLLTPVLFCLPAALMASSHNHNEVSLLKITKQNSLSDYHRLLCNGNSLKTIVFHPINFETRRENTEQKTPINLAGAFDEDFANFLSSFCQHYSNGNVNASLLPRRGNPNVVKDMPSTHKRWRVDWRGATDKYSKCIIKPSTLHSVAIRNNYDATSGAMQRPVSVCVKPHDLGMLYENACNLGYAKLIVRGEVREPLYFKYLPENKRQNDIVCKLNANSEERQQSLNLLAKTVLDSYSTLMEELYYDGNPSTSGHRRIAALERFWNERIEYNNTMIEKLNASKANVSDRNELASIERDIEKFEQDNQKGQAEIRKYQRNLDEMRGDIEQKMQTIQEIRNRSTHGTSRESNRSTTIRGSY